MKTSSSGPPLKQPKRRGYAVELEPGRDVYDVRPIRPSSAHEKLRMLRDLRAARDRGG